MMQSWAQASTITEFLSVLASAAEQLPDTSRDFIRQRLEQARAIFGKTDVLAAFQAWETPDER